MNPREKIFFYRSLLKFTIFFNQKFFIYTICNVYYKSYKSSIFIFLERIRWREKTSFLRRQIESKQIDHPPLSHRTLVYIWNRRLFSPPIAFRGGWCANKIVDNWGGFRGGWRKKGRVRDKEKKEGSAGERNLRRRLSWMGPIVNYSARLEG